MKNPLYFSQTSCSPLLPSAMVNAKASKANTAARTSHGGQSMDTAGFNLIFGVLFAGGYSVRQPPRFTASAPFGMRQ